MKLSNLYTHRACDGLRSVNLLFQLVPGSTIQCSQCDMLVKCKRICVCFQFCYLWLTEGISQKSRETREVSHTCRYTSGHLILNSAIFDSLYNLLLVCLIKVILASEPTYTVPIHLPYLTIIFVSPQLSKITVKQSANILCFMYSLLQSVTDKSISPVAMEILNVIQQKENLLQSTPNTISGK